jgi:hypothetical protein
VIIIKVGFLLIHFLFALCCNFYKNEHNSFFFIL